MIIAKFDRLVGHVYIYLDDELIASYWRVVGMRREKGKYLVVNRKGVIVGRITGRANIKEEW